MQADLVGIALALSPDEGFYIPVGHLETTAGGPQLPLADVLQALRPALENAAIGKLGHNLKYDFTVLARYGVRASPLTFDTMMAEWLCDPASRNLGLKSLAFVRLGSEMVEIESLIGKGKNQLTMADVPIATVAPYAIADARVVWSSGPELEQELGAKQQTALFRDVEMPLVAVLAEMEIAGVRVDRELLAGLSSELQGRLNELETEIFKVVGHSFNVNSTQQLSRVLFEDMGLRPPDQGRKTASGHFSTSADVLEEMRSVHPVVATILDHREISKLKSTYTDALPAQIDPSTGRVHTSYSQTGSVTGRLASSDPNLQNIPIRTELGRRIRQAFIAAPGQVLLSVDYSQIELRLVAHMADDQAMIDAFLQDQDIHAATAAAVFGLQPGLVSARDAPACQGGQLRLDLRHERLRPLPLDRPDLGGVGGVRQDLLPTIPRRARVTWTKPVAWPPGRATSRPCSAVDATFLNSLIPPPSLSRFGRERGGRPSTPRSKASAADILKVAMLRIPSALRAAGLAGQMLLQVHDELVLECPRRELARLPPAGLARSCSRRIRCAFPLKTDAKAGPNWTDMQRGGIVGPPPRSRAQDPPTRRGGETALTLPLLGRGKMIEGGAGA